VLEAFGGSERKRRDDIKESFDLLRSKLPDMGTEKLSRAYVLHKASEYVKQLEGAVQAQAMEEEALRAEVEQLRQMLESGAGPGSMPAAVPTGPAAGRRRTASSGGNMDSG